MKKLLRARYFLLVAGIALAAPLASAAPPLEGCYQRIYDAAHLSAHKGQLAVRLTLSVAPAAPATQTSKTHIADGALKVWVRGRKQSFDSLGACEAAGGGLLCGGSLSAAEADTCKSKRDGVHEDCRMGGDDPGSFQIEARGEDVLVTIRERLELVPAPYDGGPFLYFSPANAENHAFLLKRAPGACK
jgi:hypothetical protein